MQSSPEYGMAVTTVQALSLCYVHESRPVTAFGKTTDLRRTIECSAKAANGPSGGPLISHVLTPAACERAKEKRKFPTRELLYDLRSEEHTSELQSLMRSSYAVFCLKKK